MTLLSWFYKYTLNGVLVLGRWSGVEVVSPNVKLYSERSRFDIGLVS